MILIHWFCDWNWLAFYWKLLSPNWSIMNSWYLTHNNSIFYQPNEIKLLNWNCGIFPLLTLVKCWLENCVFPSNVYFWNGTRVVYFYGFKLIFFTLFSKYYSIIKHKLRAPFSLSFLNHIAEILNLIHLNRVDLRLCYKPF